MGCETVAIYLKNKRQKPSWPPIVTRLVHAVFCKKKLVSLFVCSRRRHWGYPFPTLAVAMRLQKKQSLKVGRRNFTERSLNSSDSLIFIPSKRQTHFPSSFLFETGSHIPLADIKITTLQGMTLNLWSLCLYLPRAGIGDKHYGT